jgi:glycosyltransferase involved in cell wall biosynthesis
MTNKKNTILIVCDKNPHTSFGRMTLDIKKALSEDEKFGVRALWLTTPKYFPSGFDPPADDLAIHAPSLELGWALFRRPFRRILKEVNPNKVLLIRPELGFLVDETRRALPGARAGVFVHDMFTETLYRGSIKFKLINRFFVSPVRRASGFIYNSRYTADQAHTVLGLDPNCPIVGCPIDRSVFKPRAGEKAVLRQKYGLDKYKGVCMNISLDEPRKNIPTFFALAKARPETAFVRVGLFSPWMKKWIDDNHTSNIIHYHGVSQEQLIDLYCCADIFVYPSFLEGFGMPPLEALACGVQVVAARSSALKENLEGVIPLVDPPDKVNGYLEVIDDALAGKNVVDKEAAERLLERFSIGNFGVRVRACFESGAA